MKSRYLQYDKKESSKVIGTLGSRSCERSVVRCDIGAGRASGRAAGMVGIGGGGQGGLWMLPTFTPVCFLVVRMLQQNPFRHRLPVHLPQLKQDRRSPRSLKVLVSLIRRILNSVIFSMFFPASAALNNFKTCGKVMFIILTSLLSLRELMCRIMLWD